MVGIAFGLPDLGHKEIRERIAREIIRRVCLGSGSVMTPRIKV